MSCISLDGKENMCIVISTTTGIAERRNLFFVWGNIFHFNINMDPWLKKLNLKIIRVNKIFFSSM